MKVKISNFLTQNFSFMGCIFAICIVLGLIKWYIEVVENEIVAVARREMVDTVSQLEVALEVIIEESKDDIVLLAEYIAKADVDEGNIVEFLKSQSHVEEFDGLYYIRPDGKGISKTSDENDFTYNKAFQHALNNDFAISNPYVSIESNKFVFDVAVPVKKNGHVVAVLFSETSMDNFNNIMNKMTKGSGWAFLLDYSLNIIYSTSDFYKQYHRIPHTDMVKMSSHNVNLALNNVMNGRVGNFTYEVDGILKVMVYAPIALTDWALAVTIPIHNVEESLNNAIKNINFVAFVIMLILLGLIVYIWATKTSLLSSVKKNAYYDALTGLPNLLKFKLDMRKALETNEHKQYSILKFDIEKFMVINSMFGFEVGDRILKLTKYASEGVRERSFLMAKIGVDEFLVFARHSFLNKVERRIRIYEFYFQKLVPELKNHKLSFKYGKYDIATGETNVDEIINKVTFAHKVAKQTKGMIIHYYNDSHKEQVLQEALLADKMDDALKSGQFKVYLQPKFRLADDKLIGAEALVRWVEPDGTIIYPDSFVPLFEKNGFITQVDRYVFVEICKTIRLWLDEGIDCVPISVNCSRLNLMKSDLIDDVVSITSTYNVPHEYIDIEFTESAMLENDSVMEEFIDDLHAAGITISIDDFGAGYSSLGLLKNLKANTLKLDKSFFNDDKEGSRAHDVVAGVIRLAHKLNMLVVAEGIETEEQIENLKYIKCDAVQGYFYAKPMPIEEFEAKYFGKTVKKSNYAEDFFSFD